jgi:hypothetical protein
LCIAAATDADLAAEERANIALNASTDGCADSFADRRTNKGADRRADGDPGACASDAGAHGGPDSGTDYADAACSGGSG